MSSGTESSRKSWQMWLPSTVDWSRGAFFSWARTGWQYRRRILLYTAVNVLLTVGNEAISRTIAVSLWHEPESYGFWIPRVDGGHSLNRQSAINIWMTFFASTVGGPIFFFQNVRSRYLAFLLFGACNTFVSQVMVYCTLGAGFAGMSMVDPLRLLFDVAYMGSVKYGMFELFRRPILKSRNNAARIGIFRIGQDFLSTFLRVSMLNLFGFKG